MMGERGSASQLVPRHFAPMSSCCVISRTFLLLSQKIRPIQMFSLHSQPRLIAQCGNALPLLLVGRDLSQRGLFRLTSVRVNLDAYCIVTSSSSIFSSSLLLHDVACHRVPRKRSTRPSASNHSAATASTALPNPAINLAPLSSDHGSRHFTTGHVDVTSVAVTRCSG